MNPQAYHDLSGTQFGNYRLERLMGHGTIAEVYQAVDLVQRRQVALKLFYPDLSASEAFRKRFLRDMDLVFKLKHAHIVQIYESGFTEQRLFIAMALIPGGSLRDYIARHARDQRFPRLIDGVLYAWQVAEALHYAHDQRVLHLELKPDNVLLRPAGNRGQTEAVITDLGVRQASVGRPGSQVQPPEGTLPFMSPEICSGRQVDARSDIYSLGIILYYLSVGRLPFVPLNLGQAIEMHERQPVPLPRDVRPHLLPELEEIILTCLQKDPARRYQNTALLARDLERLFRLLEGRHSTVVQPPGQFPPTVPFVETVPDPQGIYTQIRQEPGIAVSDQVVITGPGISTRLRAIDKGVLIIGRQRPEAERRATIEPEIEIELDSPLISRFHARIERGAGNQLQVVDLGSTNGSWLDGQMLNPNRPYPWSPGGMLRVGEFRLYLQRAENIQMTEPGTQLQKQQQPTFPGNAAGLSHLPSQPLAPSAPPLNVSLEAAPARIVALPGERQNLQITVENRTEREDYFYLRIQGLPYGWFTVLEVESDAAPDERIVLPAVLHPPRTASSVEGLYPFQVLVFSRNQPDAIPASLALQLEIKAFYALTLTVQPGQLRVGGEVRCLLTNSGNTLRTCTLQVVDREDGLRLQFPAEPQQLAAGEQRELIVLVTPKERALISLTERYGFDVLLHDERPEADPQVQRVQVIVPPVFTPWLLSVIAAFFLICSLLTLFTITQVVSFNTQQVQTRQAQATRQAFEKATAEAASDRDNDGLTLVEELQLGSDPDNPDTDNDRLTDWQESRQYGTNLRSRDTDNDGLDDFTEAFGCTSPNNPDTDGDGVRDGQEEQVC